MRSKNNRVELEMKILKVRHLAKAAADDLTRERLEKFAAELQQKLREIDE
jgi:Asp-tRNA(Asn)/Glu-tRNA(Gln) amidotransferase C subunit